MGARRPVVLLSVLAGVVAASPPVGAAPPTCPSAREVWRDDFEGPGLGDLWEDYGQGRITVSAGAAYQGSAAGLAVDVSGADQAYL